MAKNLTLRWLDKAIDILDSEASYLAEIDSSLAKNFVAQVIKQLNHLETETHLGRPGKISGTRELLIDDSPYIIAYRVKHSFIEILEIIHTG